MAVVITYSLCYMSYLQDTTSMCVSKFGHVCIYRMMHMQLTSMYINMYLCVYTCIMHMRLRVQLQWQCHLKTFNTLNSQQIFVDLETILALYLLCRLWKFLFLINACICICKREISYTRTVFGCGSMCIWQNCLQEICQVFQFRFLVL